jgi:hypothetical protein
MSIETTLTPVGVAEFLDEHCPLTPGAHWIPVQHRERAGDEHFFPAGQAGDLHVALFVWPVGDSWMGMMQTPTIQVRSLLAESPETVVQELKGRYTDRWPIA